MPRKKDAWSGMMRTRLIIDYLTQHKDDLISIRKLAQDLDIPYASAYRLLHELAGEGKVELKPAGSSVIVLPRGLLP